MKDPRLVDLMNFAAFPLSKIIFVIPICAITLRVRKRDIFWSMETQLIFVLDFIIYSAKES